MQIHILTTTNSKRLPDTVKFWHEHGWQVRPHYNDGLFPSYGRNHILQRFYDSDEEWMCMCDDDITLFEGRSETDEFLKDPHTLLAKLPQQLSSFTAMNGITTAVNQVQQHTKTLEDNWVLDRSWDIGKIYWIRRIPEKPTQRTDLAYSEDHEWAYQQARMGYFTGTCLNLVVRERGNSTLFTGANYEARQDKRRQDIERTTAKILELYPDMYVDNGQMIRKKFMRKTATQHNIERKIVMPYTHRLTPFNTQFQALFEG